MPSRGGRESITAKLDYNSKTGEMPRSLDCSRLQKNYLIGTSKYKRMEFGVSSAPSVNNYTDFHSVSFSVSPE